MSADTQGFAHIRYLGATFLRSRGSRDVELRAHTSALHASPLGSVHGGVLSSLADLACGARATIELSRVCVTTRLSIEYREAVSPGVTLVVRPTMGEASETRAVTSFVIQTAGVNVASGEAEFAVGDPIDPSLFDAVAGDLVEYS